MTYPKMPPLLRNLFVLVKSTPSTTQPPPTLIPKHRIITQFLQLLLIRTARLMVYLREFQIFWQGSKSLNQGKEKGRNHPIQEKAKVTVISQIAPKTDRANTKLRSKIPNITQKKEVSPGIVVYIVQEPAVRPA